MIWKLKVMTIRKHITISYTDYNFYNKIKRFMILKIIIFIVTTIDTWYIYLTCVHTYDWVFLNKSLRQTLCWFKNSLIFGDPFYDVVPRLSRFDDTEQSTYALLSPSFQDTFHHSFSASDLIRCLPSLQGGLATWSALKALERSACT